MHKLSKSKRLLLEQLGIDPEKWLREIEKSPTGKRARFKSMREMLREKD